MSQAGWLVAETCAAGPAKGNRCYPPRKRYVVHVSARPRMAGGGPACKWQAFLSRCQWVFKRHNSKAAALRVVAVSRPGSLYASVTVRACPQHAAIHVTRHTSHARRRPTVCITGVRGMVPRTAHGQCTSLYARMARRSRRSRAWHAKMLNECRKSV